MPSYLQRATTDCMSDRKVHEAQGTLLTVETNRDPALRGVFYQPLTEEEPKHAKLGITLLPVCNPKLPMASEQYLFQL